MEYKAKLAVAERLNAARKRAGLTQFQVADAAGIPRGTISRYLSGSLPPRPERMRALAEAVGLTVDSLMEREEAVGSA